MRISVALATCDSERYLGELLDSLSRQTRLPHELVVWDDASTDSTADILRAFAADAPFPVRCDRGEHRLGHVNAFMEAARRCTGDVVAFCDHDDVWSAQKLELCARELSASGAVMLVHAARLVDADLRDLGRDWPAIPNSQVVPPLGLAGFHIDTPGLAMVFRRDLLEIADFGSRPHSRYGHAQMLHDEWVAFVAGAVGSVSLVSAALVRYRQHGSNQSGWVPRRRDVSLRPALNEYERAASYAEACASYLDAATSADAEVTLRLREAARAYRHAAENWRLRASLYRSPHRLARARTLCRLTARRAYRGRAGGGLGRAALGKDLTSGVLLGRTADR